MIHWPFCKKEEKGKKNRVEAGFRNEFYLGGGGVGEKKIKMKKHLPPKKIRVYSACSNIEPSLVEF
jgi:hypothetical protein